MRKQLVVHIGPRKTGTTAIQSALAGHRDELVAHGVAYPGERNQHHQVVNRFLGRKVLWHNDLETDQQPKKLDQLLRSVRDVPRVVMSSEVLSQFLPADIDRFVAAIPDRDVTVVISYRRYEDLLPSTWQQAVKEGLPLTLEQWLTQVLQPGAGGIVFPSNPAFPRRTDLATLAEDWGRVVGGENVVVVVVDSSDPQRIFRTFEELLALPEGLLDPLPGARGNRSMTAEEAEFVRASNALMVQDEATFELFRLYRMRALSTFLNTQPPDAADHRSVMPAWAVARAREECSSMVDRLTALPVPPRVMGELATLVGTEAPEGAPSDAPDTTSPPATPSRVSTGFAAAMLAGALRVAVNSRSGEPPAAR